MRASAEDMVHGRCDGIGGSAWKEWRGVRVMTERGDRG
jgi:hypothetical protein